MGQYIGARYVPKFMGVYDPTQMYEALDVVDNGLGTSYITKIPTPAGTPLTNTTYWAIYGASSGAIVNLQNQINNMQDGTVPGSLQEQIDTNTSDITALTNEIDAVKDDLISGKPLIASLVLNSLIDVTQITNGMQGACYVENDIIVVYYAMGSSNTGVLVAYHLGTFTELWRHSLPLYHGNSITYNPHNRCLYVSGCLDAISSNYVNLIFEIEYDNPSVIKRTITLPDTTMNYSIAYDADQNKFYATNAVGSTAGVSDIITIYDDDFNLLSTVLCDDYPSVKYGISTQGVQLAIDGVAYVLTYTHPFYIAGYDVTNGKLVSVFNIPEYASDCRKISEPEALLYDSVNKRMFLGFPTQGTEICIRDRQMMNIAEINAFKGIAFFSPRPIYQNIANKNPSLYCKQGDTSLKPTILATSSNATVQCFGDILGYAKLHGYIQCYMSSSSSTMEIYRPNLSGVEIGIQGAGSSNRAEIYCCVAYNSKIVGRFIDFSGDIEYDTGYFTNLYLRQTEINLTQATFKALTGAGTKYHAVLDYGCIASLGGSVTYEGTVDANYHSDMSLVNGVYA